MNTGKRSHAAEPETEESVCPALVLENLKGEKWVVMDRIYNHLHEMDAVALHLDILVGEDAHGNVDETLNTAINLALQAKHHGLGQFASTYPLDTSLNTVGEHISDHGVKGLSVLGLLSELGSTKLDKVIQSRQHILEVVLSTGLESSVNQLKGLPHSGRDRLGGESAAVDDFENFVIEIVKLVLQGNLDDGHKDSLNVEQDVRGALECEDQSSDSLQDTQSSNALVVILVVELAVITNLALLLEKLAHNSHISVPELLTKCYGKRSELSGEDLHKVLHDIGERIDISLVGKLEQLLHNRGNVLLHACSNDIMADKRLESESGRDTDWESRVGHAVQDVSVDSKEVVLILEVELLELLDGVASTSAEVALWAGEVGEDITDEEVFNLISNGAFLAQNNRCQGSDHAQSTLLGNMVLLIIRSLLVLGDNGVDELENLESLLATVLCEVDKEVRSGDIRSRRFLEVVQLSVKVLVGLILELLDILLGKAEDREDEVGNKVGKMRLKMCPHLLGSYGLVEEDQSIGKARSAEPRGFGNPFLDLLEVVLEDLGGNVRGEVLGKSKCVFALTRTGRVAMSANYMLARITDVQHVQAVLPNEEAVQVEESPLLSLPPVMLLTFVLITLHSIGGTSLGNRV